METFRNSPLGLSLADRFRKVVSPSKRGSQAFSDIQTNLPTKQIVMIKTRVKPRLAPNRNPIRTSKRRKSSQIRALKVLKRLQTLNKSKMQFGKLSKPELTKESSHVKVLSSVLSSQVGHVNLRCLVSPNRRS